MITIVSMVRAWWQRRQHERELRRRYREFESAPATHTRSPWIRSLIGSPLWNENVRAPGRPRIESVSDPEKARGRDYVLDLLRIERCIRFRSYPWAWQGVLMALGDDLLTVVYLQEYSRIFDELRETCPDERLRPAGGYTKAQVLGMANRMFRAGTRSIRRPEEPQG